MAFNSKLNGVFYHFHSYIFKEPVHIQFTCTINHAWRHIWVINWGNRAVDFGLCKIFYFSLINCTVSLVNRSVWSVLILPVFLNMWFNLFKSKEFRNGPQKRCSPGLHWGLSKFVAIASLMTVFFYVIKEATFSTVFEKRCRPFVGNSWSLQFPFLVSVPPAYRDHWAAPFFAAISLCSSVHGIVSSIVAQCLQQAYCCFSFSVHCFTISPESSLLNSQTWTQWRPSIRENWKNWKKPRGKLLVTYAFHSDNCTVFSLVLCSGKLYS